MRWRVATHLTIACLAACSATSHAPGTAAHLMAEVPEDQPTRLLVSGNEIVSAAVALGPGSMPQAVRTAIDAVAPHGELAFRGREWGPRGTGYRIEKHYRLNGEHHVRTVLIADDGHVMERAHSVPVGEVPKPILHAALEVGHEVRVALIVSGPEHEEFWQCEVGDRIGRTYVVRIGLGGRLLDVRRRVTAHVDV